MITGNTIAGASAIPDKQEKHRIYPKLIKGPLYKYREITAYLLLALLFAGPFIRINQEQLILLNILERKFVFFGLIFMPQDFYLFVLAMLTFTVFIILFTVIFGRVWCGWACPQTIFMEMVFRRIEYWIEGDVQQQRKLDASGPSFEKVLKKGSKHFIFILLSFLISNIFLAYIIGSDELLKIIREPVRQHIYGFAALCVFTAVFYLVFSKIRELVCTVICPYGRLQGVLLDRKTLVVAYDHVRGEPRGHLKKTANTTHGDCIDCGLCVQVCPTGIDIRKGTQLECVNCTACIDACDMVMEKVKRETRLIGFKSEEQIISKRPFSFSKRIYGYAAILAVLVTVFTVLLLQRSDIGVRILRAGGTLYQLREDGTVSNLYNAELVNKTPGELRFEIRPSDPGDKIQYISRADRIAREGDAKITFFVIRQQKQVKQYKSDVSFEILSGGKVINRIETTFFAPPGL